MIRIMNELTQNWIAILIIWSTLGFLWFVFKASKDPDPASFSGLDAIVKILIAGPIVIIGLVYIFIKSIKGIK